MKLARIAHPIVLAWGWRRTTIAISAGAASTLAMAPFNAWPVLFVTFPILVLLIDGAVAGRLGGIVSAAITGWWFGLGYFLAGLYWIGFAFLVDARSFGWLMPFAVVSLPAGLALFTAAGVALARALWTPGFIRIVTLALALTGAEWLRAHVLTGFPWNAYGYALTSALPLAQAAALVGLWGLTLLAVLVFASPAVLTDDPRHTRYRWLGPGALLTTLAALGLYGQVRLAQTPTSFVAGVQLRIMQPNLPQDKKFNYSARQQVIDRYLALSDRATGPARTGMKDITHLIWPESAFPFFLAREPEMLAQIAALIPQSVLITGAVRPAEGHRASVRAYNSVYVIDHGGSIVSVYDKVHLVPFGEYLPWQELLESFGLRQLTSIPGGFLAGDRRRPMRVPGAPTMLPLICYEIVFPDEALPGGERPGWLLNLTNDGWFGASIGPYQHFQQARVRAIEHGLPLVRAANTGISAVIDPLGRIVKSLPLGVEGVLDAPLPRPIAPTLYGRFGDAPVKLLFGAALLLILRRRWHRA